MWWREHSIGRRRLAQLATAVALASLSAGCFEPLYGTHPSAESETERDRLAGVDVVRIPAQHGSPTERLAVELRNAVQYDLNGGSGAQAPTHRLEISVSGSQMTVTIDPASGRPSAQIGGVVANYKLIEIATGKVVVTDTTIAHVDYDIPGVEQRFAKQRAQRDAEDRATEMAADAIRNRLASYFVAGT